MLVYWERKDYVELEVAINTKDNMQKNMCKEREKIISRCAKLTDQQQLRIRFRPLSEAVGKV